MPICRKFGAAATAGVGVLSCNFQSKQVLFHLLVEYWNRLVMKLQIGGLLPLSMSQYHYLSSSKSSNYLQQLSRITYLLQDTKGFAYGIYLASDCV